MAGEVVGTLAASQEEGFEDGLEAVKDVIIEKAIEYMPAHDPIRDPDPAVNLAERVFVYYETGPAGQKIIKIVVDTEYAAKQHEAMWFDHPRGGGPKYLERAVTETIPLVQGIIAEKVEARTKQWARERRGASAAA
jgi:hypothetical protein